ncbi:MAG: cytidylate kinase-like family protein [Acidobacteria bacterium]|nr:cytidylate kinase-like family protein [Acidobacteriota bacterium]
MSRPISSLSPDIERRLAGWVRIQERLPANAPVKLCPTITLSREFGCEGFPLAERVKELLEGATGEPWNLFDKSLIELVAKEEDIPLRLLRNLGDMSRAIEAFGLHASDRVTHDMAFDKVSKYMLQIAKVGNAILVGRGSAILCQGLRNCFHFRLVAGLDWRVERYRSRTGLSREEALAQVKENSRNRERFVSQCLGEDVTQPRFYDAVFNNEHHGIEQIAQAILAYVRAGWEEPGTFRKP